VPSTTPSEPISNPSILLTHGVRTAKAFVLLHGLTASPEQFVAFGRLLYERGANVSIPRLPRHGHADRLTTALEGLTAEELQAFAGHVVASARELGERTIVVGFSLGGLLAAWIAQHHEIERVVSIAPFLGIAALPARAQPHAMRLALRLPNRFLWWNPFLRERQMPAHGYPRYSTHALAQAYRLSLELFGAARSAAPQTQDITLVLNGSETTVNNRNVLRLSELWRTHRPQVNVHRLRGLPPSHDIIEPLRSPRLVARVYPQLLDIVDR